MLALFSMGTLSFKVLPSLKLSLFLPIQYYAGQADFVETSSAIFFNLNKTIIHK